MNGRVVCRVVVSLYIVGLPVLAWAQSPPAALVPRIPTGFSTVEQGYRYAPPDEGILKIPLGMGIVAPNEVAIEEPMMCNGGSATAYVKYSKSRNKVILEIDYDGLPYRMSYTRPRDVSTPYNKQPISVRNGKWQIWFVQRSFSTDTVFYYDASTLKLIGNEYDTPRPPEDAIAIKVPTLRMVSSPLFEGKPNGEAHVRFEFAYDRMMDVDGTAGVAVGYLPYDLCKPDEYGTYYTNGGLPTSLALSFDDVLTSIHQGYGMAVATSLEPDPKPAYLKSRDNPMLAWTGTYPNTVPKGYEVDPVTGTLSLEACRTHIAPPWPKAIYNACSERP